ncbi:helix-turn-helix domain-containing protein [Streptomyces sp. NBC_01727]|uniref:helix-turn-helix domain-containing protein n=1 Tax=Streptomyces sp. NBC_01727 TaxID=2975924 RepID=UPI002E0DDDDD|nr:helix-turn-helix domain-containing protein [Streptomyces sp. NBC_01727]
MIRTERVYLIGSPNFLLVEIGWTDKGSTYTFSRLERDGRQQRAGSQVEPVGISHGNTWVLGTEDPRGHVCFGECFPKLEVPMSDPLRRIDALVEEDTLPAPQVRQRLRLAAGLTQTEVAEAIGVKRLAVARWEAGLAQPHRGNRLAYAHLLRRLAVKHPNAAIEEEPDEE